MATWKVAVGLKFIDNLNMSNYELERIIEELEMIKEWRLQKEEKKESWVPYPTIKHLA